MPTGRGGGRERRRGERRRGEKEGREGGERRRGERSADEEHRPEGKKILSFGYFSMSPFSRHSFCTFCNRQERA